MLKKAFLFFSLLSLPLLFLATPLSVKVHVSDSSGAIHNAEAEAFVKGGTAPYSYKWEFQSVGLNETKVSSLVEGGRYSLTVTDSDGNTASELFIVPANSFMENINAFFYRSVSYIGSIMMFDLFAGLNLYDPIIYDNAGNAVLHPNGDPKTISIPFIVIWLLFGAIFFTLKFRFINFRGMKHAIDLIRGRYDNPDDKGEITHFQALTTALSATVGLGNIAGVAVALSLGGPGATFWMIIAGLLGMASKFTEATLGVKYRRIDKNGHVSGGPMYYLKYLFGLKKKNRIYGNIIAGIFAVLLIGGSFGGGNMFQANQAFAQLTLLVPQAQDYGAHFGVVMAIFVGLVIIGGIKSIAKVTSKIVPFMAGLYLLSTLIIIFMNISKVGEVATLIFNGAFAADAMKGGFVGVMIMGVRRAVFSNEAGVGSAAIAHSAVKTKEPVSEGIVALLGPFIDTVIICTLTAFVLLFTGYYDPAVADGHTGSQLTSDAFGSVFSWFPWLLLISIVLFAFSTMVSWSYYGVKGFNFLFGGLSQKYFGSTKVSEMTYKVIFLFFVVVGSSSSLGAVIDFSDMMILCMAFPNILGLLILAPRVKRDLNKYFKKLKSGEIKRYS